MPFFICPYCQYAEEVSEFVMDMSHQHSYRDRASPEIERIHHVRLMKMRTKSESEKWSKDFSKQQDRAGHRQRGTKKSTRKVE